MRLQTRVFYLGQSTIEMTQYRWCRENGWGGGWESTPLLALASYRRRVKADA